MNELQVFKSPDFGEIRTVEIDGEPWFVAADICRALELSDVSKAIERLDNDEKGTTSIRTLGGNQQMSIVNEPGLYSLVLGSRKPEAKVFKRWITHEVIPAIRRTGAYQAKPLTPAEMFQLQAQVNLDQERRLNQLDKQTRDIDRKLTDAMGALALPSLGKDEWQVKINRAISETVERYGLNHQTYRAGLYEELEDAAGCDLAARQRNLKERMRRGGATYKEAQSVTKLVVIAQDQKLRSIFEGIVRRSAAQRITGDWDSREAPA